MISISITQSDFDVGGEYQQLCLASPGSGAIVFFVGIVRDLYDQQSQKQQDRVEYIELQHYAGMTEALCQEIAEQANERFPFEAARIVHRVGKIHASEQIVFVAIASRHRDNAFSAAQFIMDYLKTRATLWKKEVGSRGDNWVGLKQKDKLAADRW